MGEFLLPHTNRVARPRLQRDQGPPPAVLELLASAAGSWAATGASTTTTTCSRAAPGAPDQAATTLLRPVGLRRRHEAAGSCATTSTPAARSGTASAYDLRAGLAAPASGRTTVLKRLRRDPTREIEPPSYFRHEERRTRTPCASASCATTSRTLEALGLDVVKLRVQLHRKLAFPLVARGDDADRHPVRVRGGAAAARSTGSASASSSRSCTGPAQRSSSTWATTACCRRSWRPGPRTCSSAPPACT